MPRLKNATRAVWCVVIAAAVLLLCSKSSPLFVLNDWMDANIFFTMGKSMFNGKVLYRDVFDHKGPVLYLLYGIGWLLDHTGFTGVLVLEIAVFAVFLGFGLQTASLLTGRELHPAWAMLPAAAIAAGRSFSHGGSAEEFLLPFLAAALYGLLAVLVQNSRMSRRMVLLQGVLAGCALWLKYTVLGFYLVWVLVLAVFYGRRGWWKELGRSCGIYLVGMALATLPWVLYFGIHGALKDWFTAYFYDNLFLYSGTGGGVGALVQHIWWAVRDALPVAALLLLFFLWAGWSRRWGAAAAVCLLAVGLAGTSLMGGYLVYYGLVLAVFAPLGLVPLTVLAAKMTANRNSPGALGFVLPGVGLVLGMIFCWVSSPNAPLRGRPADSMPQVCFAEQIQETPQATVLNYGTLDGGFYTASGVLPPCRYFCVTNMPLQEQWTEQDALMENGGVGYVVALAGNLQDRFPRYHCIDQCSYDGGEGTVTWYLYRRQ